MNGHQKQREQSANMIEEALFELMREKSYAGITVSEIAKRADISRRTFYRLYREKDEVLRRFLHKLCDEYCTLVPVLACYDIRQISQDFFGFWYRYREILLLMHESGMEEMLYYEISRASLEVVKKRMGRLESWKTRDMLYFASYSAGGFMLLLWQWMEKGMDGTPEGYAERVSKSILGIVNASCE